MAGKFEAPRRKGRGLWLIVPLLLLLLAMGCLAMTLRVGREEPTEGTLPSFTVPVEVTQLPSAETTEATEPPVEITANAAIAVQGDLLMHATFFQQKYNPACRLGTGEYDFSSIFRYLSPYTENADYAVANLETTLGGDEFPYQGNPTFNCPDPILDAVKAAGYDLLLTANNHSYDTLMTGIDRTLEKSREAGLDTLGTRLNAEEDRFTVKEINGIKIGMVCYTYTMTMSGGKPKLNDNAPVAKPEQINYFSYNNLSGFYDEVGAIMEEMKAQGAEATMLYIHWGTEYEVEENQTQRKIAQKMCDLGFDVIVGGHPHVVQPMALLESTVDPAHKTVCIYSLGNAVSNQRRQLMRLKTGHTEDGALFTVTFEKWSDGTVAVADCNVLPTWVNLYENSDGKNEYNILPLDAQKREQWAEIFDVSEEVCQELQNSYDRTMAIVGDGLETCREYLAQRP
ncbi:MAG: CapA family protein [Oscillospiraceae bacterium]|nr:CapA family protein [Oscillospiraceae bacterium]